MIGIIASSKFTDPVAEAFILRLISAGITVDGLLHNDLVALVRDLKKYDIYSYIYDCGLLVGGTAAAHALTLKNVAPSTIWVGSPAHSATGVDPNGTTQYGKLGIIPSSVLTNNDYHLAFYSRENTAYNSPEHVIGAYTGNTQYFALNARNSGGGAAFYATSAASALAVASAGSGFFIGSRTASNAVFMYRNGTLLASNTTANTGTMPTVEIYLCALNNGGSPGFYTDKEICFWSVGAGLSATRAANFTSIVNAFQTARGRNTF